MPVPASLLQAPLLTGLEQARPRLAVADGDATTEVWACAGTGKTTLLAQWAAELRAAGEAAAWISVPAAGSSHRLPALTHASLAVSATSGDHQLGSGRRVNLLFDDVHHLNDPAEAYWLAQLIESRPRGLRFILAGRHPPKLPAGQSQGFGPPSESGTLGYRTADLAFTLAETVDFLAARGISLKPSDVESIHRRTGGWAAALTLLCGLAAGNGYGTANGVGLGNGVGAGPLNFEPGHRAAADYLVTEILDLLPATYLSFLLTLCVADAVTVQAAVRLTHRGDAGRILDHLELQTGLLRRAGPSGKPPAYVFHPVLLSYLRTEFRRQDLAAYARALGSAAAEAIPPEPAGGLTPKEREILRELPRYQTVRDIAARQRLSPNTVKTHMRALYEKLGVSNRTAAVEKATKEGLL